MTDPIAQPFPVADVRKQFPALHRKFNGKPAIFLDGPAGSQTPQVVIAAIANYLTTCNANHGGLFPTSIESDAMLDEAHRAAADLLNADDPATIAFGANMTSMTFALSRSLSRTWRPGDEVIVTELDHDANVTPWAMAARDAGATVRTVRLRPEDCTLDLDDLHAKLSYRTKLVAVGAASNSVGTISPIARIAAMAHAYGAEVFVDAVHYAPHRPIDVVAWDCDYLACSAYKFFGPHVGLLWGRRERLESLEAYKVRPAANSLPGKWMTGTQNHECIAGVLAAIDYLAALGRTLAGVHDLCRRRALAAAYAGIEIHETAMAKRLLAGLAELPGVRVRGILDEARGNERVSTISFHAAAMPAERIVTELAAKGVFAWHGNYYAIGVTAALGLEPSGMVRLGALHYNTLDEVDGTVAELARLFSTNRQSM